jgi:hypothetical protein
MAEDQYRARAAELRAQSELEQNPEAANLLKILAGCFQQLADKPTLPIEFELPRKRLFPPDPF